jgi:1-phosphofructokinase family hexose kinase
MPRLARWYIRTAFLYFAFGFTLGGAMLVDKWLGPHVIFVALRQVHVHFLLVGWMVQFIFDLLLVLTFRVSHDIPCLMIVTVTPNPTLDRTLVVRNYAIGGVHRASETLLTAGGKGLNVARAVHVLNYPALALSLIGGVTGRVLAQIAAQEGLPHEYVEITGETRVTTVVVDPDHSSTTVINEAGPIVDAAEWNRLVTVVRSRATNAALVALCGRLPPGLPMSCLPDLVRTLTANGIRVAVDTSGEPLRLALSAAPWLIKVNTDEAGQALGWPVRTVDEARRAARQMRERGICFVILTMGAMGAVLSAEEGEWLATPPSLRPLSLVGSGDALLGGWLVGLLRGDSVAESLRLGVAVAAANVLTLGTGVFRREDVAHLLPRVQLQRLAYGQAVATG